MFNITKKIKMIIIPIFLVSSLQEADLLEQIIPDAPVTFTIVDSGSQRGKRKLVSSDGYEFVKKVMFFPRFVLSKMS